jgi:hypothetical protein
VGVQLTCAIALREVASLEHELRNDAVEHRALEPQILRGGALLSSAQSSECKVNAVRNIATVAFGSLIWYLKFSHVRGHTSALRVISILPAGRPPMAMSKNTTGLDMVLKVAE